LIERYICYLTQYWRTAAKTWLKYCTIDMQQIRSSFAGVGSLNTTNYIAKGTMVAGKLQLTLTTRTNFLLT